MHRAAFASVLISVTALAGCTEIVQFAQGPRVAVSDAQSYNTASFAARATRVQSQTPGSEKAMQACVEAAGVINSYEMLPPAAKGASFTVLAGRNVTQKQAGAINACIANGAPVAARQQTRDDYAPELASGYSGEFTYNCGSSVFVGGSGYCITGD
ncbi:hypothetical protein [Celeribacter marinus]|uniref:Uncharacterized protein n=1 Tax=Celeribacter marinus TaxID=1397108 RepID=A0A0P0A844_9RHOB|nr:hypothetical protein [Celeribacter marinus]ALI56960.1 hypothetical protein IMCC12053_3013 [Celeribacter marinus]SFK69531.1 hypothetical protein SAMN05444421_10768 [Celeribacter marinus]